MNGQAIAALAVAAGGSDGLPRPERVHADFAARAGRESRTAAAGADPAASRAIRP